MIDNNEISKLRKEYSLKELRKKNVNKNPFDQFSNWFQDAVKSKIEEPNAMILATADKSGTPSLRVVLLKSVDIDGLIFYTNYNSQKGRELSENPNASILFFWLPLERQIRISGKVIKLDEKESFEYFKSRPYESQIGAWASKQSEAIDDRTELEKKFEKYKSLFKEGNVPLPPNWGGFKLVPQTFEFWQGRESRLHDRIRYSKSENGWELHRISPK